jgi:hypothetical protein
MCALEDQEIPKRTSRSNRGMSMIEVERPSSRASTVSAQDRDQREDRTEKIFTAFGTQGSQVRILPLRPTISSA